MLLKATIAAATILAVAGCGSAGGAPAATAPGARGATSQFRTSVAQVNDALRRLPAAVGSRCPSPSPSGS